MAEENNEEGGSQKSAPEPKEYSDIEKRAMEQGWVPQDQYQGSGKWRDAEEFLDRGELFSKIDEQKRRLERAEMTTQELKKHLETVRKTEYQKALKALKSEKIAAVEVGDAEAIVELDEQIAETKQAIKQVEQASQQQEDVPNPHLIAWRQKNTWYDKDEAMQLFANAVADKEIRNGNRNPTAVLAEVERRVKIEFAHKFTNPNRDKAGAVEGGGNKSGQKKDTFQLTAEERRAMEKFVKHNVMTEAEYIADIKASRGE